jgi:hypothetical protein
MFTRRISATLFAVIGALLVTTGTAGADWSPPFSVSESATAATEPQLAVAPAGDATVVWAGYEGLGDPVVLARKIEATGQLGPIQHVTEPGETGTSPDVAVDADGNATVVWTKLDGGDAIVRARRITVSGTLEDAQDVSVPGEDANSAQVAVDAADNAIVAWRRPDSRGHTIQARRIDAAGGLGTIVDISDGSTNDSTFEVAAGSSGNAFVVWVDSAGSGGGVIEARRIAAGGGLGPITDLSATGEIGFDPQIAVDAAGLPTAAWQRDDGTIRARQSRAPGQLDPIADLSAPEAHSLDLAVDPTGIATVVWSRFDGTNDRGELRRLDPAGALDDFEELWSGGDDAWLAVSVDGSGDATVVWMNLDASGDGLIRSRTAPAAGGLGPALDLSPRDTVTEPALAIDLGGHPTTVWGRLTLAGDEIVAARYAPAASPANPPAVPLSPAQPSAPVTGAGACPVVGLGPLRPNSGTAPKRRRIKGVAARLRLSGPARLEVVSGRLTYRLGGRTATARLRTARLTTGNDAKLRFALPKKLAARLPIGTRVKLALKLRAGRPGCGLGGSKTLKTATRVAWVPR